MKKILAIITICSLLIGLCTPAFAGEAKESYTHILNLVKPRIPDTDQYENFYGSTRTKNQRTTYNLTWETTSEKSSDYKSMNITATNDGIITSYNVYDSKNQTYTGKPTLKTLEPEAVIETAKELVAKLNPEICDNLEITMMQNPMSLSDTSYTFSIQRMENGIPVYGDSGYVTINENADKIINFSINYTEGLTFPDITNAISAENAKKAFAEKIGMTLKYKLSYKNPEPEAILVYEHDKGNTYIDALSAEAVTPITPSYILYASKNEAAAGGSADSALQFSEAEIKELSRLANLISEEDAEKGVRENKILDIDNSLKLSYISLSSNGKNKYFYSMNFASDDMSKNASVTMNAANGEVISMYRSENINPEDYDKKADENIAKRYVEALAPNYYKADNSKEYRFEKNDNNTFRFVRYANNIPCYENYITVRLNPANNKIISYNIVRSEVEFPYPTKSDISEAEACEKLFEQIGYELTYFPACSNEKLTECDIAHAIYMTDKSYTPMVYAISGELVYKNETRTIGKYTDIEGHYAEKIILTLAKYGIGFSDEVFRPDEIICQKDYIELLASVVSRHNGVIITKNHDYAPTYKRAVSSGILKDGEEAPDSPVTREKAAIYMIRAINLEEVAKLEGIYLSLFEDVSANTGYISILSGMGIVNGYGGCFYPQKEITRAEAMVMIYNYLSR